MKHRYALVSTASELRRLMCTVTRYFYQNFSQKYLVKKL